MRNYNLAMPFLISARKFPDKLALYVDRRRLSYAELLAEVTRVTDWMLRDGIAPKRVGILASRSLEAYAGILASAWVGAAYVPIDIALPDGALAGVLGRSGLDALIADASGSKALNDRVLSACPLKVLARRYCVPSREFHAIDWDEVTSRGNNGDPAWMEPSALGYMMYTSGSTGVPKAVVVNVGAVDHLLWTLSIDYPIRPDDRTAGTSPVTFDVSVFDMFSTWSAGAALFVVPSSESLAPAKFIQENQITIWSSAPSIAAQMGRMGLLTPNAFPSLRRSFFAGEAMPVSVAESWQAAAPLSKVSNMYGPTEATVLCIGQDFGPDCHRTGDCVSIGWPYRGMKAGIADPDLHLLSDGNRGELLISGPQLAVGYLDDEERTSSSFVMLDEVRWYRTGDLAYRDATGVIHYLGRIDNQVKLLGGTRVELGEIESHLRQVTRCDSVAAVAWPLAGASALGIVAFLGGYSGETPTIRSAMRQRLPNYMVPSRIHVLPELPLSPNGKVDRKKLIGWLNEESRKSSIT